MKALRTWLLALFLIGCVLATPALAADTVASGTCGAEGSNLTWTLDSEGVLTISGTGAMEDYSYFEDRAAWYANRDSIKTVSIGSGVTSVGTYAFYYCKNLTGVMIPDSVTRIGGSAFESCSSLTGIIVPDGVTNIGSSVFRNCSSLTSATIPDGITNINYSVFENCSSLTGIIIPDSVTSISGSAFSGCSSLSSIIIPNSVTSVGERAFSDCSGLTSVVLSDTLTSISKYMFSGCSSLSSITIPGSVTAIGSEAFYNCSSLTGVTIPDSVTDIGGRAFSGCSSLTSVSIGNGVTTIGYEAFLSCKSLSNLTMGSSVTSIGSRAFCNCSGLTNVYITDMDAWCRISFANDEATPMCSAKNIYLNGSKVVSVAVPQGVTSLRCTFYNFKDLIRVTIPYSVTSIGVSAFENCSSLTSVTIPKGVTSIGGSAFYGCSSLTSVTIPTGVTSISSYAFKDCSSLVSATLPEGITSIGNNAFADCHRLTDVIFPDGITSIGDRAFDDCDGIISITIPGSVTSIGSYAFTHCTRLESVTFSEGVSSIGEDAFFWCASLEDVKIPSSMTSIGGSAFDSCDKLSNVFITDVKAWSQIAFGNKTANPIWSGGNLYLNDIKVEILEIPEGVQVISSYAFVSATCIKGVAIPKSLVGVAANAFTGCRGIEKVYYAGSETEWKDLAISAGNDPLTSAQIFYNSTVDDYYCRITVKVSDGGRIFVDRNTAAAGETVTITTAPYAGYELSALYVDGTAIEGNSFTVTGNHEVSALFTKLPVTGGTQDYRLEGITVQTAEGEKLQELTAGKLLVSVSVRHLQGTEGATILLAQYDAQGRYQGLLWLTLDEMPLDMALKVTLPVDNSDGKIVHLKAFVVDSLLSAVPVGSAVSFGDV